MFHFWSPNWSTGSQHKVIQQVL